MSGKNYMIPKAFFTHQTFKKLSPAAKLLYMYYSNEFIFPSDPLKVDDEGRPIIKDRWKEARDLLGLSASTGNTARRELLAAGLIRLSNRQGYLLVIRAPLAEEPQKIKLLRPNEPPDTAAAHTAE